MLASRLKSALGALLSCHPIERNNFFPTASCSDVASARKAHSGEEENYYLSIKTLKQHNGCDDDVASSARCFHIISELLEENRIF